MTRATSVLQVPTSGSGMDDLKCLRYVEEMAFSPAPQPPPLRTSVRSDAEYLQRSWLRAESQRMSPSGRWSTNDETKSVPMVSDTLAMTLPVASCRMRT